MMTGASFSQDVSHLQKDCCGAFVADKALSTFSKDATIEHTITLVYYKFARFYGRLFATLDICPDAPDLKRNATRWSTIAIGFSNAPLWREDNDNTDLCNLLICHVGFLMFLLHFYSQNSNMNSEFICHP